MLFLDQHSPEEDSANGSWVHLTVNCRKLGAVVKKWGTWKGGGTVPLPWVRGGAGGQWTEQKLQA